MIEFIRVDFYLFILDIEITNMLLMPNVQNEISDIQQRLQKMDTLEKEIESLRYELDSTVSEEESSSGNELHRSRGFWRWNG
jgi:cell shape-determining protein MreC